MDLAARGELSGTARTEAASRAAAAESVDFQAGRGQVIGHVVGQFGKAGLRGGEMQYSIRKLLLFE